MTSLADRLARLPAASPPGFDLNQRRCLRLDLSGHGDSPDGFDPPDADRFPAWIEQRLCAAGADYSSVCNIGNSWNSEE